MTRRAGSFGLGRMQGSCTCCDSHAEAVRLMMTSPRIGLSETGAWAASAWESPMDKRRAEPRTRRNDKSLPLGAPACTRRCEGEGEWVFALIQSGPILPDLAEGVNT